MQTPTSGKPESLEWSVYFSRPLIENSVLRFALRHQDLPGEEASQAILVQFVALAGSLGHGLDW